MRICFVGESFVNGTGDPECLGWTGRICATACRQGYNLTYYNLGVRRETSTELRKRWLAEVTYRLPPEIDGRVVFCFGVNDTSLEDGKTRVSYATSLENAQTILTTAQERFPVLMVSPLHVVEVAHNQRTAQLVNAFASLCQELQIPFLDVFTPTQASQVWRAETIAGDGAHPGAGGYAEVAHLVQTWQAWQAWFAPV